MLLVSITCVGCITEPVNNYVASFKLFLLEVIKKVPGYYISDVWVQHRVHTVIWLVLALRVNWLGQVVSAVG